MANPDWEIEKFFARSSHATTSILDKIKNDIVDTAQTFQLSVRASPWGDTSQTKLCVYGALPLALKTKDLVVPIQIWLSSGYPIDPPTIYVVPSGEEKVLSNVKLVDGTGLCYCPLLHQWSPPTSTLRPVLMQLAKLFTYAPPLWVDDVGETDGEGQEAMSSLPPPSANAAGVSISTPLGLGGTPAKAAAAAAEGEDDCVVCLSTRRDTVIVPCGHFCCCSSCVSNLTTCPVCRKGIQYRQKVFH